MIIIVSSLTACTGYDVHCLPSRFVSFRTRFAFFGRQLADAVKLLLRKRVRIVNQVQQVQLSHRYC